MINHRTLDEHFEYLVDKGLQPSAIRSKMALDLAQYQEMADRCIANKKFRNLKLDELEALGKYSIEELNTMWSEIELLFTEIKLESDYEKLYQLHLELDELTLKYSTALLRKQ